MELLPQYAIDEIDWYNERAGIREFDGGQSRAEAQREAQQEWLEEKGYVQKSGI